MKYKPGISDTNQPSTSQTYKKLKCSKFDLMNTTSQFLMNLNFELYCPLFFLPLKSQFDGSVALDFIENVVNE